MKNRDNLSLGIEDFQGNTHLEKSISNMDDINPDYDLLEKAKGAPIGTINNYNEIKTADGWKWITKEMQSQLDSKKGGTETKTSKASSGEVQEAIDRVGKYFGDVKSGKRTYSGDAIEVLRDVAKEKGRAAGFTNQELDKMITQSREKHEKGAEGSTIKDGDTVTLNSDVHLTSFSKLEGENLTVSKIKSHEFASGAKKYAVIQSKGKEYEVPVEYLTKTKSTPDSISKELEGKKSKTSMLDAAKAKQKKQEEFDKKTLEEQALPGSAAYPDNTSEDLDGKRVSLGDKVQISKYLTTDPAKKQGQDGKITSITDKGRTVEVQFSDGTKGKYGDSAFILLSKKK